MKRRIFLGFLMLMALGSPLEALASSSESAPVVSDPVEKVSFTITVPAWTTERDLYMKTVEGAQVRLHPGCTVKFLEGDDFAVSIVGLAPDVTAEKIYYLEIDFEMWNADYPENHEGFSAR